MSPNVFSFENFELSGLEKRGGMSKVRQAKLVDTQKFCALKYAAVDIQGDSAIESFNREIGALADMDHPNIVRMLGIGLDGVQRFIVLEWLSETLVDRILSMGPVNWDVFYEGIGRPLLEGLRYAHGRRYVHRDFKPLNVMFNESGVPKITDFGIARDLDRERGGKTFAQAGSHPWTPAEGDDGIDSERRDLYSWAALAVACLTGRLDFKLSSELRSAAVTLGASVPVRILESCLAELPAARPVSATPLLWDLDDFHKARVGKVDVVRHIGLEMSTKAHTSLEELIPDELIGGRRTLKVYEDFQEPCEIFLVDDGELELRGKMFCLRCVRASEASPWLLVKNVTPIQVGNSIKQAYRASVQLLDRTSPIADATLSRANISFLEKYLASYAERELDEQKLRDEERYLSMLQDTIVSRVRALRDLPALEYFDGKWIGGEFAVTVKGNQSPSNGEQRLIRTASGLLVFGIVKVELARVFLRPVGIRKGHPTAEGLLQIDTVAQKRALERQDDAIKTLRENRAASPSLRRLILQPHQADIPESGGRPATTGLSPDKEHVLDAALGLRQLMVVRGPPGTGKTKLITEVVKRYLHENPDARVLISAQTHIAIDHVIEKLLDSRETAGRVVRIARTDDDKVSPKVKDALLQNRLAQWCQQTAEKSRKFVQDRGAVLGLDAVDVELSIRLEALVLACDRLNKLDKLLIDEIAKLDSDQLTAAAAAAENKISHIESETISVMTVTELEAEKKEIFEKIQRLRDELRAFGKAGSELADLPDHGLREWSSIFKSDDPKWEGFRKEIELQVAWLDLLGQLRQFEEIVLRSASVVAGTCVGLGSSEAFTKTQFDLCIIDEASKATATEALIPMVRSHRCLIVGDPVQLPPFEGNLVEVEGYADIEVRETMLDYLIPRLPAGCVFELTHQHRMCKSIGELISHAFYEKRLVNERPDSDRAEWIKSKFPKPVLWVNTKGGAQSSQGHSFVNRTEQDAILDILAKLQAAASRAKAVTTVAIIAGYAAQARALDSRIQRGTLTALSIDVATVDSFQGRESDTCIFSVTLSNDTDYLGFLRSLERLNVALSRPRDLLVIVGDQEFCYDVPGKNPFPSVINFIEANPSTCETQDASF